MVLEIAEGKRRERKELGMVALWPYVHSQMGSQIALRPSAGIAMAFSSTNQIHLQ